MASSMGLSGEPAMKKQQLNGQTPNHINQHGDESAGVAVNRKKAKRRAKQAAKQAAATHDGPFDTDDYDFDGASYPDERLPQSQTYPNPTYHHQNNLHYGNENSYADPDPDADLVYSDDEEDYSYHSNHYAANGAPTDRINDDPSKGRKSRKKKKSSNMLYDPADVRPGVGGLSSQSHARPRPPNAVGPRAISDDALRTVQRGINSNIWNTSSQDERQRIKEYWLSLGEDERKALVKIEKNDVLKKMKDQQKHSCSCTVCGRKRVAIEEELEVLYDAYYKELELYANQSHQLPENGGSMLPPNRRPSDHAGLKPANGLASGPQPIPQSARPPRGRIQELPDDVDEDEDDLDGDELDPDEYSEDEYDEEEYSDEEPVDLPHSANEFFAFGKSLTVKGGILTVADDLLKNDGQKFIDMMEQLAERRMQREEAYYNPYAGHPPAPAPHNHASHSHLPPEEEEFDDEEDEEYDSQDEEYDEDETDSMTESQRMDEGRRMFQIFAARMFEQRVLTAYREKRAMERQQAFLRDLEEEEKEKAEASSKNAAKKAKQRQKEKAKKEAVKEEKARKDAEKAAADAAEEQRKLDERRKRDEENRKKEEDRKKKLEEARRAQEEEKARKKAEERARDEAKKEKEKKAREKKEKEDAARRERETKEREEKLRLEKEEKQRQEQARLEKLAQDLKRKAEQDAQSRLAQQPAEITQSVEPARRVPIPAVVALPPTLKTKQSYTSNESPQAKAATPVTPKEPTPVRAKEASGRTSQTSAPLTPEPTPRLRQITPPKSLSMPGLNQPSTLPPLRTPTQPIPITSTPHMSPMHTIAPPPGMPMQHQAGLHMGIPQMGPNGFLGASGPMMPGMMHRLPHAHQMPVYPQHLPQQMGPPHRPFFHGPLGAAPPGINPLQTSQHQRTYMPESAMIGSTQSPMQQPVNLQQPFTMQRDHNLTHHSRQGSLVYEVSPGETPIGPNATQSTGRPDTIKQPASAKPQRSGTDTFRSVSSDVEEISTRLGSSALLDDSDEPLPAPSSDPRRTSTQLGMGLSSSATSGLLGSPFDQSPMPFGIGGGNGVGDIWRSGSMQYGPSSTSGWGSKPASTGWGSSTGGFNSMSTPLQHRSSIPRPITVRLLACQACQTLARQTPGVDGTGYHDFKDIVRLAAESARQSQEPQLRLDEVKNILDTEGDAHNGGGSFVVCEDVARARTLVKWVPNVAEQGMSGGRTGLSLGEIGSPLPGNSIPTLGGLGARGF